MKIVVCIKQVPDTNEVRLDPVTNTLIREGVPSIINPDDKAGLETALRLKDENPEEVEVTVVTMGPPQAEAVLRESLAMGADRGILVTDRAFGGADTWATSCTLAGALENLDYDLIITGRQAIDGDTAQVGPQIAEHIGLPQVSYVESLELKEDHITVQRQFEDRYHIIDVKLPCLITAITELAEPRYMSVGGIFDAFQEEITVWGYEDIKEHLDQSNIGLKGSPTKVKRSYPKEGKGKGVLLTDVTADEGAQAIVAKLQEKYII
ncbi:MAG: electron transfer flavoprotein subunit beta/FixA family protein [Tissierellia bacterium]|nr:electron transfer flavoprotein subunit beta/FixA family protein [Tissierellia bacterium]